jgi:hypothetical protein
MFVLHRACVGMLARVSGTGFVAGLVVDTDKHVVL